MRRLLVPALALVAVLGLLWGGLWLWQTTLGPAVADAQPLDDDDQEIAWIYTATSGDQWERLVAALKNLQHDWHEVHPDWPTLSVSLKDAFLEQSAAVPQIALRFDSQPGATLWIRWYKLSSDIDHRAWLEKLRQRGRPPLAIVGGDTSDRALSLARGLEEVRDGWAGSPPLLLITTATADRYYPGEVPSAESLAQETWPKLLHVYPERTFRFCFTNSRMAEAVLDFVRTHPHIWHEYRTDPATLATALAQPGPLDVLGLFAAAGHLRPTFLYTLAWTDDRYSLDLSDRFSKVFVDSFYQGNGSLAGQHFINNYIAYSVGDYYQPNPSEQHGVGLYLALTAPYRDQHQLLAVPTGTKGARRFLRTLGRQAPKDVRNIVAVSGDAITFNNIYRDREVAWNVLDLPLSLIFFSHRNPIDASAGFRQPDRRTGRTMNSGTQDLLLTRDIVEAFVQAAWTAHGWRRDASEVRHFLQRTVWEQGRLRQPERGQPAAHGLPAMPDPQRRLFDDEGSRRPNRGEHVVWLQPGRERARNLPNALIWVWSLDAPAANGTWRRVGEPLFVDYNQANEEDGPNHVRP